MPAAASGQFPRSGITSTIPYIWQWGYRGPGQYLFHMLYWSVDNARSTGQQGRKPQKPSIWQRQPYRPVNCPSWSWNNSPVTYIFSLAARSAGCHIKRAEPSWTPHGCPSDSLQQSAPYSLFIAPWLLSRCAPWSWQSDPPRLGFGPCIIFPFYTVQPISLFFPICPDSIHNTR